MTSACPIPLIVRGGSGVFCSRLPVITVRVTPRCCLLFYQTCHRIVHSISRGPRSGTVRQSLPYEIFWRLPGCHVIFGKFFHWKPNKTPICHIPCAILDKKVKKYFVPMIHGFFPALGVSPTFGRWENRRQSLLKAAVDIRGIGLEPDRKMSEEA